MKTKSLSLVFVLSLLVVSCNQKQENGQDTETNSIENAPTVTQLLADAEQNVDSLVTVKGTVTHTCQHSGKRCFIVDSVENQTIKIEATGNIVEFNKELVGTDIFVKGVLREKRLEKSYIDELKSKTLKEKEIAEDGGEHCNSELENIQKMYDWMKEHNKDYFSIFYIDGNDFEEIK